MRAAYAMHVDEFRAIGMTTDEAIERVEELLLPPEQYRAAQNRRAFAHLIAAAEAGRKKGSGS